jgi:hypothetical protein
MEVPSRLAAWGEPVRNKDEKNDEQMKALI